MSNVLEARIKPIRFDEPELRVKAREIEIERDNAYGAEVPILPCFSKFTRRRNLPSPCLSSKRQERPVKKSRFTGRLL